MLKTWGECLKMLKTWGECYKILKTWGECLKMLKIWGECLKMLEAWVLNHQMLPKNLVSGFNFKNCYTVSIESICSNLIMFRLHR